MVARKPPGRPKGTPKTGGRQKGTRNKTTVEIREAAQKLLHDGAYQKSLRTRLLAGKAPHMEQLLHHYAYGKPVERHEVGQPGDFSKLSDEELKARIADLAARL
jgi:hypothetical protein